MSQRCIGWLGTAAAATYTYIWNAAAALNLGCTCVMSIYMQGLAPLRGGFLRTQVNLPEQEPGGDSYSGKMMKDLFLTISNLSYQMKLSRSDPSILAYRCN